MLGVVHDRVASSDYPKGITAHNDRRVLVDGNAEHVWIRVYETNHVELAVAHENVGVDDDFAHEPEAAAPIVLRDRALRRRFLAAEWQVIALNSCAGRPASDHAAAVEEREQLAMHLRVQIRVLVPPRVVHVRRIGFDVVADASLKDRQPVDEGGGVVLENGVDSRALNDRGRGGNVVLAAGLPVVVLPPFLEVVEPDD